MDMDREYKIRGREIAVNFKAEISSIGNDGIGSYEFWGSKGFDKGRDYVEEFEASKITVFSDRLNTYVKPSAKLLKLVEDAIYNDDSINETLTESYEEPEPEWEPDLDD